MYEVKSCGVTVDITPQHLTAVTSFNQCNGAEVVLLKYNSDGTKQVIDRKWNHLRSTNSTKSHP